MENSTKKYDDVIAACIENGRRLLEDSEYLNDFDRFSTAKALAILAQEEFAKAYNQVVLMNNEILPAATELFDSAKTAYQEGKIDYLHMLDAQRTFFNVQNEYIESLTDYHNAKTDIERLINNQSVNIEN